MNEEVDVINENKEGIQDPVNPINDTPVEEATPVKEEDKSVRSASVGDIYKVAPQSVLIIREVRPTVTLCESLSINPKSLKITSNELLVANTQLDKHIEKGTYKLLPISIYSLLEELKDF